MSKIIKRPVLDVSEPMTRLKSSEKLENKAALAATRVRILVFSSLSGLDAAGYLETLAFINTNQMIRGEFLPVWPQTLFERFQVGAYGFRRRHLSKVVYNATVHNVTWKKKERIHLSKY